MVVGTDQLRERSRRPQIAELARRRRSPELRATETLHGNRDRRRQSSAEEVLTAIVEHVHERCRDAG